MTAPDIQQPNLTSLSRLFTILDDAYNCRIVCKLHELDRGVSRVAVVGVQGEEQWGEHTSHMLASIKQMSERLPSTTSPAQLPASIKCIWQSTLSLNLVCPVLSGSQVILIFVKVSSQNAPSPLSCNPRRSLPISPRLHTSSPCCRTKPPGHHCRVGSSKFLM